MGRTFHGRGLRKGIFIAFTASFLWNFITVYAQDNINSFVELRNGVVTLSEAADVANAVIAAATAEAAAAGGSGNGNGGGAVVASTVPYARYKDSRKLILMRYSEETVWQMRAALLDAGASILDYVAYNTLLVQAKPEAISLASRYNALAAEYPPSFKVAPETSAVFAAAAAAVQLQLEQHRRNLATSSSSASTAAANDLVKGVRGSTSGLTSASSSDNGKDATTSPSTDGSRSSAAVLAGLSTWRSYVSMFQTVDNTTTQPSSPPPPTGISGRPPAPSPGSSGTGSGPPSPVASNSGGGNGTTVPELYAATARLVPGLPDKARRTIAEAWPQELTKMLGRGAPGDQCRPQAVTEGLYSQMSPTLIMYFCAQDYEKGVSWLTKLDTVIWVEPALKAQLRNAAAGWILQTGNLSMSTFVNPTSALRPYWRANLRGQGTIVGLEDTGIDMSHCNFIDDRWRPGSLRTLFVGSPPRLYLPNHRKVVQYMLPISSGINRWFGDQPYGHGTHTAGSIAGAAFVRSASNSSDVDRLLNQRGTGSAPESRLSFFDLSPNGGAFVPMPIDAQILPYHYAVGARISSSSWGYGGALAVAYTEACRQFDSFAWRNPEFVSVVAAGNDGDNGFMATVTAPATAKNVLTIGATVNNPPDFSASPYNMAILFRYNGANGTLQSYAMWPYLGTSDFYWRKLLDNKEVPFRVASPLSACTSLVGNYTAVVVLVDLSDTGCTADQRATNAQNAGAAAIMFIAAGNGFLDRSQPVIPVINDFSIIYGLITRAEGLSTVALLTNGSLGISNPHMTFQYYPKLNLGIDSLAYYSSYGPLPDGRIKPDIVAPGGLVESAASGPGLSRDADDTTCSSSTMQLQGTSMATPLVAGHLALVQQYFRGGYYPTGTPGDPASVGFEPSGMLLKAAAIVGAKSLKGGFAGNAGFFLGAAPDGYQGWGRMDLSGTLPLPNFTHPLFRVSVADFGVIDQNIWIYLPGIVATGTGPITAALVWHDYPGSGAAKKNLINDLDFGYIVNQSSYTRQRADSTNNVERVELTTKDVAAGDRITFVVFGRSIRSKLLTGADAQLPQRWAVVVAGHFNGTLRTALNPAYWRPQRFLLDTQATMRLQESGCMYATGDSVMMSKSACTTSASTFTLVEELAQKGDAGVGPALLSDSGYLYTLRDTLGRCLSVPGNSSGTRAAMAKCNASDPGQKIGLFKSSGSFYFLVPSFAMRAIGAVARCLRRNSANYLVLFNCNDDDPEQIFELQSPVAGRPARMLPPSPLPPAPAPQAPSQQWYPYSLVFRADWYPVGGPGNLNDYDYLSSHNGYGDDSYGAPLDDLDIIVSWTYGGVSYSMGRWAQNADNISFVTRAVYGGDNTYYGTQYEIVYFPADVSPPPTPFHVCVAWQFTQMPTMQVVMSVYKGYVVKTVTKVFDTSGDADYTCDPSSAGYVGTFNPSAPAPPPSPPSPSQPQPRYPYPFLIRTDWTIISGTRGRPAKPYDFDIVVSWNVGNESFTVSSFSLNSGGAVYGGDNMRSNGVNFEFVYWPDGASLPPTMTFHVCLRWNGNPKPLAEATLSVYHDGRYTTSRAMIDTTFDWSDNCEPGAIGYVDSYWVGDIESFTSDLSYSSCFTAPAPSPDFSLYFLVQWTAVNATAGTETAIFDWDLVVAWRWGGQVNELSPYSRFVAGAVHGGDNIKLTVPTNSEAAYWPTALTGVEPSPTQYDVCVRWYSYGSLNVTLTVLLYNNVVYRTSKVWDGAAVNSKTCSPMAAGYLGSYNFTGSNGSAGTGGVVAQLSRRAMELQEWARLVNGHEDATASASSGGGSSDLEQLASLVP